MIRGDDKWQIDAVFEFSIHGKITFNAHRLRLEANILDDSVASSAAYGFDMARIYRKGTT
ncbi:MAG: hypothetical protein V3T49_05145 [Dehalococcoidia bacterium]